MHAVIFEKEVFSWSPIHMQIDYKLLAPTDLDTIFVLSGDREIFINTSGVDVLFVFFLQPQKKIHFQKYLFVCGRSLTLWTRQTKLPQTKPNTSIKCDMKNFLGKLIFS